MHSSINPYGLNLGQSPVSSMFGTNKDNTSKLVINGKSIDIKSKEELLPPYLRELREKNQELKYENIMLKVQNGEDLSPAELAAIKEKNPELYEQIQQEIRFQKQFEQQLKNCKTKKEAQELYINTQLTVAKLCGSKSGSGASIPEANREKYNRMIARVHKSYQKYAAGKLDTPASDSTKAQLSNPIYDMTAQLNEKNKQSEHKVHYDEQA